jgi:hypothetical protein
MMLTQRITKPDTVTHTNSRGNGVDTMYVIGDVHGEYARLMMLLRKAGIIDSTMRWSAGAATLCFLGDYVDRGPDGIGVIDLIMCLEREAADAGGRVISLLGNHDAFLLAAYQMGDAQTDRGSYFKYDWMTVGGQAEDLARMTPEHAQWLRERPAMLLVNDHLLMHADAMMYADYGRTVDSVNNHFSYILHHDNVEAWNRLLDKFSERYAFYASGYNGRHKLGIERARAMLHMFGGKQIIHGHTPISVLRDVDPTAVTESMLYAHGLCVNVDAGMYRGSPGVVHKVH